MMRDCLDQTLSDAFRDVPVPTGLSQRLIERLEVEQRAGRPSLRSAIRAGLGVSRRSIRWALIGGGMALAVGLLVALSLTRPGGECFSESFVLDVATQWPAVRDGTSGQSLVETEPPARFPFSAAVLQVRGARWQEIDGFLGCRGIVYDLPGPAGASASLYVVEARTNADFPETPSLQPFTTGGCCASAWRQGKLLYVLVVQGDPATYRSYLGVSQAPVA